ncbi:phosphotransferase [Megalodesulfovibrio paquesii]
MPTLHDQSRAVAAFLQHAAWIPGALSAPLAPGDVRFLAAGEYNENYQVIAPDGACYVFRLNHGSQIGQDRQIEYEYNVLHALQHSGVTPKPLMCDPRPHGLVHGALLMEFLPGRPLDYRRDSALAAWIFARIHTQPVPAPGDYDPPILCQPRPVAAIAKESLGLLWRHPEHPRRDLFTRLMAYHDEVMELDRTMGDLFDNEPLTLVNTEVNSGNFLIDPSPYGDPEQDRGWLVDWEKAVISVRYQDLGHFLVPTTTLWKSDFRFTPDTRREFLKAYREALLEAGGPDIPLDELSAKTRLLERTILLRALSWCYMAWFEYVRMDRGLKHPATFQVIERYLGQMEDFLALDPALDAA